MKLSTLWGTSGTLFSKMLFKNALLLFDVKIDSILVSILIFDLIFQLIIIFICDVKRGLNANLNY